MSPTPEALPSITSGPACSGPSARQLVFKAMAPVRPILPWAVKPAAAPSTTESARSMSPPVSAALSRSLGASPSSRSSSARPERNFAPLPSAPISHGFLAEAWLADQLKTRLPAVPGITRSRPETVAEPLKFSPPRMPIDPVAEATTPWPFRSALRIRSRPSLKRVRSTASRGAGPPIRASRVDPPPPAPASVAVAPTWPAREVRISGPETLASR